MAMVKVLRKAAQGATERIASVAAGERGLCTHQRSPLGAVTRDVCPSLDAERALIRGGCRKKIKLRNKLLIQLMENTPLTRWRASLRRNVISCGFMVT